jgi:predicted lipoprotein with Yx(FWY)xxD motif
MSTGLVRRIASVVFVAGACAGAALGASSVTPPTVKASSASPLGAAILVSSKGSTLYHFLREGKGTIRCTGSCTILWPPLLLPAGGKPVAGPGVDARKLGTIARPDGRLQVTYNGLALYRDFYDKAGQANGQGQDRLWFAVTPAGKVTKARAAVTPAPAPAPAATPAGQPVNAGSTGGQEGGGLVSCGQQVAIDDSVCVSG